MLSKISEVQPNNKAGYNGTGGGMEINATMYT